MRQILRHSCITCLVFLFELNLNFTINNVCTLLRNSALYVFADCGSAWPKRVVIQNLGFSPWYILYCCWTIADYGNYICVLDTVKWKWKFS
jgi:hypothetical protein